MITITSTTRQPRPRTVAQQPTTRDLKTQPLTARWITENGKLICLWFVGR